jgi:toxin ParE1/3/4
VTGSLRSNQPASEELAAAVRWYERQRAGLGADLLAAVVAAVASIETNRDIGTPLRDDPRTRRLLIARFPYQVVYRLHGLEMVIVAFAHLKRRPGYWKQRE